MKPTPAAVKARAARVLKAVADIGADPYDEGAFILVECGLHSGFPLCCIEFFVKDYFPLMERSSLKARRAGERYRDAIRSSDFTPGYIPCPDCLKSRRAVRVRRCDWHLSARERRRAMTQGVIS